MRWLGDRGKVWGFLLGGTPLLWRWMEDEIVTLVGVLGTWPAITEIRGRERGWRRIEEWNMEVDELRRLLVYRTI